MQYTNLGSSDIRVSKLCLGTMTWGEQNSKAEAHAQLDIALDHGVNFIDTAEMYSFPSSPQTYGATETIIGNWLAQRNNRDKILIATKVVGPCQQWMPHIRNGETRLDRKNILAAVDGSLRRLQTDYIDLYQTHWPQRKTNYFGRLGYEHDSTPVAATIDETLAALDECVRAGKVRAVGVSNETPWGVAEHLRVATATGAARIVSIQNPYSLLNRTFEVGLAEFAMRERVGLLAYSPLGFGMLTGKYLNGAFPENSRLSLFKQFTRYLSDRSYLATEQYLDIARRHSLSFAQMSLAYVTNRPFTTSNIIGATTMEQLEENLQSADLRLSDEVVREIELVHKEIPNPAP